MRAILFILLLTTLVGFRTNAQSASATAQATISACIIAPLTIAKKIDMNFGNAVAGVSLGTVILTTTSNTSPTGGVVLPSALAGTISAAKFETTGMANQVYSIVLPTTATLTSSSNTMTVTNFNSNPTVAIGGNLGSSAKQDVYVGGTLNVGASQAAGNYSGTFNVTVAYD